MCPNRYEVMVCVLCGTKIPYGNAGLHTYPLVAPCIERVA